MGLVVLLSACSALNTGSPAIQNEVDALKEQIQALKDTQMLIAQRVGLGELVRPDKIVWEEGQLIGSNDAPIVMIEFTDLQCPFCKRFHQEVWPQIKADYVDKGLVQFVAKEFPLVKIHKSAGYAAVALRCAGQQGQYEQAKELLFAIGTGFNQEFVDAMPESLDIDQESFTTCLKDMEQHNAITASVNMAQRLGIQATPAFIIGKREGDGVINYEVVTGAGSIERFTEIFSSLSN
jgi:protein-disulfide isomerase